MVQCHRVDGSQKRSTCTWAMLGGVLRQTGSSCVAGSESVCESDASRSLCLVRFVRAPQPKGACPTARGRARHIPIQRRDARLLSECSSSRVIQIL